jgi:hypothetical protein
LVVERVLAQATTWHPSRMRDDRIAVFRDRFLRVLPSDRHPAID